MKTEIGVKAVFDWHSKKIMIKLSIRITPMVETIQGKSNDATACIDFKVQESIRAKYLVDTNDGKEAAKENRGKAKSEKSVEDFKLLFIH